MSRDTSKATEGTLGEIKADLDTIAASAGGLPTGGATAAKQDTGNTSLASLDTKQPSKGTAIMTGSSPVTIATDDTLMAAIKADVDKIPSKGTAVMTGSTPVTIATNDTQMAALILALSVPTTFSAVTPSDATDTTSAATKGLYVTVAGAVYVRGTGDSSIINIGTFPTGTFIPGKFQRVGASTTATVVAVGG